MPVPGGVHPAEELLAEDSATTFAVGIARAESTEQIVALELGQSLPIACHQPTGFEQWVLLSATVARLSCRAQRPMSSTIELASFTP